MAPTFYILAFRTDYKAHLKLFMCLKSCKLVLETPEGRILVIDTASENRLNTIKNIKFDVQKIGSRILRFTPKGMCLQNKNKILWKKDKIPQLFTYSDFRNHKT